MAIQQGRVHHALGSSAALRGRVDGLVVVKKRIAFEDGKHAWVVGVLIQERHLPLDGGGEVDLVDALEVTALSGLDDLNQMSANDAEGFLSAGPVLAQPRVGVAPHPPAAGLFGFGVIAMVDAELEGGAAPDAAVLLQALLQPIDEGVILAGVGVLLEGHGPDAFGRPGGEEGFKRL